MACLSVFFLLVGLLLNILYATGACYHSYRKCVGLVIAGGCLQGLSVVSAIITIFIFRRLKQQFDWETNFNVYIRYTRNMPQCNWSTQQPNNGAYVPPVSYPQAEPRREVNEEIREECRVVVNPTIAT